MNKHLLYTIALSMLFVAGCGTSPKYIDTADSKSYTSMGLDYHDIEKAAVDSMQSLLKSAYVRNISNTGSPKVLMISDVINDTMQNIDTDQLTRKITRDMRNSGKFALTLAVGDKKDKGIAMGRSVRDDDEFDQHTTIEKAHSKPLNIHYQVKSCKKILKSAQSNAQIITFFSHLRILKTDW